MPKTERKIPTYEEYLAEIDRQDQEHARRDASTHTREYKVYRGGPKVDPKLGVGGVHSWNEGDIDFDPDGSIFIRNPYLANRIEQCIATNYENWIKQGGRTATGEEPKFFRLTRDEGWSGEKQNIVC